LLQSGGPLLVKHPPVELCGFANGRHLLLQALLAHLYTDTPHTLRSPCARRPAGLYGTCVAKGDRQGLQAILVAVPIYSDVAAVRRDARVARCTAARMQARPSGSTTTCCQALRVWVLSQQMALLRCVVLGHPK